MFGMTMHGSGPTSVFGQKRLTILNPFVMDLDQLSTVFSKHADQNATVAVKDFPKMITEMQQGREPTAAEMEGLLKFVDKSKSSVDMDAFFSALTVLGQSGGFVPEKIESPHRSNIEISDAKRKHGLAITQEFAAPMCESHKIGWQGDLVEMKKQGIEKPNWGAYYRSCSTEISNYNDCVERHHNGRSVGAEFSNHSNGLLKTQATQGEVSGFQHPVW